MWSVAGRWCRSFLFFNYGSSSHDGWGVGAQCVVAIVGRDVGAIFNACPWPEDVVI